MSTRSSKPLGAVIRVADYDRAKSFYQDKIGLEVQDQDGPGMGTIEAGTPMLMYESDLPAPENTVAGFLVDDVDGTVAELRNRGVIFEEYDAPGLKTIDGIATMGDAKSAWFKDSEGNILSIASM
jgi:predicted enzyme related to lactoylglutathione lyase